MIYNLVLNSTNVIDSINKTQYSYTFINGNFYIPENSKMCISQCMIPYSWFNINSTLYNNNSFSYVWYYGNGSSKTYTVTIPNGFYSISDIQQYLEVYMISQNQYFTNTITGQNLYYIFLSFPLKTLILDDFQNQHQILIQVLSRFVKDINILSKNHPIH